MEEALNVNLLIGISFRKPLLSLSLSLGKKFEQVCLQRQGNSADSWASVDSGESSQRGWKYCVTSIDFLWGGFSWMIIREIHTFFVTTCVSFTLIFMAVDWNFYFPWTDIYLSFFFPIFFFFFHVFFAVNPTMNSVERVIWNHYNMVRKVICFI